MRSSGWFAGTQSRYAAPVDLHATLAAWDGKRTDTLRALAGQLTEEDRPALLRACRSNDELTARAASWVLKACYEAGMDIAYPADMLSDELHWEVALHLLQSLQHVAVDIPPELVGRYLDHKKPMVRAWALDAYVRLGALDAADVLQRAQEDPAASVRARARNLTT